MVGWFFCVFFVFVLRQISPVFLGKTKQSPQYFPLPANGLFQIINLVPLFQIKSSRKAMRYEKEFDLQNVLAEHSF